MSERVPTRAELVDENRRLRVEIERLREELERLRAREEERQSFEEERAAELEAATASLRVEIEERVRAEESLRTSEERYRAVVDQSRDNIFLVDCQTLAIVEANPALHGSLGYDCGELIGLQLSDVVAHDEEDIRFRAEAVRRAGALYLGPRQYRRKDGTLTDVEVSVNVISHGGRDLFCIVSRDITERSRLEEQLRQSQKMEAVGKLAGGVAHDFNNMLCVIDGHAEMLLAQMDEDHAAWGDLLEISKAATRASELTRQLLAFSRKQVVQVRELDPNQVIQGMEKLLRRLLGEDLELRIDLDPAVGTVMADPGQLEQIVMNLVVNARDAMPTGGTIRVRTRDVMDGAELFAGAGEMRSGRWMELEVRDNGCGMDRETREHLFEPFFTTKRQGTGLGLATVYGVVQQTGGHIDVDSRVDEGTTFRIVLPCLEPEESVDEVSVDPSPDPAGSETVLVVEDEEQTRKLVVQILARAGYHVLEAGDAEQALSIPEDQLQEVDLLLTDVVMPGVSGPQLARHLRQVYPRWKVLFMSGYAGEEATRHGLEGADAPLLPKPFKPVDLTDRIRELLDRSAGEGGD